MLNISHLYKSLLSKDIEININSKIENIKNANIWSDFNVKSACDKIDFTNLGLNDIKYHASLLENISKLSVDLLLDYDYYKDFIFKGQFRSVDYDDKLRMLGYEIEDDYWHNVRKPSRDTVIMNVFLSCLYNSIIGIMNDHFSKTNYDGEEKFENDLLEDQDIKAENKLISEIKTSKEMKNPTLTENCDKIDIKIGVIEERECKSNKLKCPTNNCGEPRFNQTSKITDKTNRKTDYSDLNRNNDRTNPGNSKIIMRDITSNNLNENNETTPENHRNIDWNVVECSKSINVETEWKCWYKKCERMNKIKHNYCQTCKLDRNPPDPDTQFVKCYAGNNIREIWICRKCEKHNPKYKIKCEGANCGSFRFYTANDWKDNSNQWVCDKCTFVNNNKGKCCTMCNSERNNDICQTASFWKCWFKICRQTNDNQYKFCQHCKLDRFGNKGRGELVKCQDKDFIKEIWICQKCFKYNNLSNKICSAKNCDNSRF